MFKDDRQDLAQRRLEFTHPGLVGGDQVEILKHAIIVDRHRHEDHIAPLWLPIGDDIAQEPEFGRREPSSQREPPFGKNHLCHATFRRHLHIAGKDAAIENPARPTPDEERPHRPDDPRERPNPRPFPHRERQRRGPRHEIGHEEVIHVRAVVDDEHHRRIGIERFKPIPIEGAEADSEHRP